MWKLNLVKCFIRPQFQKWTTFNYAKSITILSESSEFKEKLLFSVSRCTTIFIAVYNLDKLYLSIIFYKTFQFSYHKQVLKIVNHTVFLFIMKLYRHFFPNRFQCTIYYFFIFIDNYNFSNNAKVVTRDSSSCYIFVVLKTNLASILST